MNLRRSVRVLCLLCNAGAILSGSLDEALAQGDGSGRGGGTGGGGGQGRRGDVPVPVVAVAARLSDAPVYLETVGTTRALKVVTLRPQVDGKLISVNFQEGQDVKCGDVIARIDPTTYQAQLDQAIGKKALDEAQLANAKIDLARFTALVKTKSVSQQQLDTQRALVAQLEAQVSVDQGQIASAQASLKFTTITSPIDGRTGIRLIDEGNVVHASESAGIVVITQIRPIATLFTIPQQRLREVNKVFARGPITIEAIDSENGALLDRGSVLAIDNQVDQGTGTVQVKAEFPNANLQLWPGEFILTRLFLDKLHQVLVVPSAAVQRGPEGAFVYVIQPNNTVAARPVTVTQQNETQAIIASGLQLGDRVATTGFAQLTDGHRVTIAVLSPSSQTNQ
jgi:membrane fusion protein, multidrug efflux system